MRPSTHTLLPTGTDARPCQAFKPDQTRFTTALLVAIGADFNSSATLRMGTFKTTKGKRKALTRLG